MRRARRGGRQYQSHQIDQRQTPRPFHDQNQATTTVNTKQQPDFQNPSMASPSPSPQNLELKQSVPTSEYIPKTSRPPPNRRKPKWESRNRRGRGFRPRFVQVGRPSSGGEEDGKEGDEEEEEGKKGEDSHSLELSDISSNRDTTGLGSSSSCTKDIEERKEEENLNGETIEASDSIEAVDDIGTRLEELLLDAEEEPDLSEEMLKINDQLQEDEVIR